MREFFAAVLVGSALVGCGVAQEKKPPAEPVPAAPEKAKLGVGDVAPPLKVTKWLQGEEVKAFANDKVYIVEIWATWCGPCIRAMPHLNDLQQEYKAQGLEVIGLTSKDPNNSQKAVEEFVTKNGKKFNYRFAYCEDRDTDKAYMEASGQGGIPCSFVVGKDGKIAFIGHPMELDDVLPLILSGKWEGKKSADALNAAKKELGDLLQTVGEAEAKKQFDAAFAAKTLEALAAYEKKYPDTAQKDDVVAPKLILSLKAGQFDAVKTLAESMIERAEKKKKRQSAFLVGLILSDKDLNPMKKLTELALKGADVALKTGEPDISTALGVIDVYLAAGKKDQATAAGNLAVELATKEGEQVQKQVTEIVKQKLAAEKK